MARLVLLSLVLASFVACVVGQSTSNGRDGILPISLITTISAANLFKQAASAYGVNNQDTVITTNVQSGSATVQSVFLAGGADFAIASSGLPLAVAQANPQYTAYPILASAIVPVYSLPDSAGLTQLILPIEVMCDIELGVITNWNHSSIQDANPSLVMPDLGITVFHLAQATLGNQVVTSQCGKISPTFAAAIPVSQGPTWPTDKYFAWATGSTSDVLASNVIDTVGGYAFCTYQNVVAVQAKVASIRNVAGFVVTPTPNAISLNILELAVGTLPAGVTDYDLSNPSSPNAWPMCTLMYFWVDTVSPRTTCATKANVLDFILYVYQDSSVALLATALSIAMVNDLFLTQTNLISRLKTEISCQGAALVSSSLDQGFIAGFPAAQALVSSYTNYYSKIDSSVTYTFQPVVNTLATERVVATEIDLALVNTRQLSTDDVSLMTAGGLGVYIPALMTGIAVTFVLPLNLTTPFASWSSTTSTLPSLLPLSLNLETVAGVFVGKITRWDNAAIIATNPQLAKWLAAYPNANPAFSTIICCTNTADLEGAGQLLMQNLNGTKIAQSSQYSSMFAMPLTWVAQQLPVINNFNMIDIEPRMMSKATSVQLQGGSAISYRLISGSTTDPTAEFQIVQTVDGVTETIAPQPNNFQTCATVGWASGLLASPTYQPGPIAGCYPLASSLSFGLNLAFTGDTCTRGNRSLNLFYWMTKTKSLSQAALDGGVFRMADVADIKNYTKAILQTATCDGETLLITLPIYWSVNNAIFGFGVAVMVIGFVAFAASAFILVRYRSRSVLRSSSVPFLGLILFGLTLLVSSVAAWSHEASTESCGAFMWLASLGFSLIFVPFFAKTYRIYAIFSRQKLKVIKMSNTRLMALVGGLIGAEFFVMLAWSQVSALKPITYLKNIGGTFHQANHCSVDNDGMKFVIVEAVYKGAMLVCGTMLAFSTRKVSTAFNESSAIAFSIYNVLFSSVIIGAIVYFVDAFEDTLVLLFIFLIFWVSLVTWGLLFGQKFYVMFSQTEEEASVMSKLSALQTEKSDGFSFVSVIGMPVAMLKSYVGALDSQLIKARKQLSVLLGTSGEGLGIGLGKKRLISSPGGGGHSGENARTGSTLPVVGSGRSGLNEPDETNRTIEGSINSTPQVAQQAWSISPASVAPAPVTAAPTPSQGRSTVVSPTSSSALSPPVARRAQLVVSTSLAARESPSSPSGPSGPSSPATFIPSAVPSPSNESVVVLHDASGGVSVLARTTSMTGGTTILTAS